ncbi:hypothetical protein V1227_26765 [Lentzea sp. DG1S-22]|uniref:hypothetical protein n=1 Tax=Lentzea sp. DG1S-22 TaxID=3108822 RepID=UPI002E789DE1|nr:hypothetical protein [Lentzea sp. DG1S-22]WVH78651.1 hypothetical protein V1227_26765 [Lentzea sp. DG1S-22]
MDGFGRLRRRLTGERRSAGGRLCGNWLTNGWLVMADGNWPAAGLSSGRRRLAGRNWRRQADGQPAATE